MAGAGGVAGSAEAPYGQTVCRHPQSCTTAMAEINENNEENIEEPSGGRKWLTTFPYSKTTCVCNCGKYNLQDLPRLRKILPDDYEYKLCEYLPLDREDKFLVTLRMTLSSMEEALEWKRRFEEKSLTTHVKDKTFPKVERVSIFKAQYRCQFFDRRKNRKKLPEKSKFRDCHSILFINIKKYFKNTVDRHMPTYCTVIRLHYAHDHPLDTADVLKKRQLNEDIKQRFLELFRQGMKPKDALDKHKRELLQKLGPEKYRQVVCDGYYVPNVPKAYRLYYQVHGKGVSAKTTTKRSSRHNPNPDWIAFQNCSDAVVHDDEGADGVDDNDNEADNDDNDEGEADHDNEVGGVAVEETNEMGPSHLNTNVTCSELMDIQDPQNNLTSEMNVSATMVSHDMSIPHSLGPKPTVDNIHTVHSMVHHNGHNMQKLGDTAMAYPNLPAANSVYTDMRNQNISTQNMPGSSFGDSHIGMGIFNPTQPAWENFNMAHQQSMVPYIPPQHNLGFQNIGHQNPAGSYMILPNTSCQNPPGHYMPPQAMVDPSLTLQNSMSRTSSAEVSVLGSGTAPQHSWAPNRPPHQIHMSHAQVSPPVPRQDKVMPVKFGLSRNQIARSSAIKRAVQKKRKTTKELNMKHVTKRWMDKKPKVEAETQNLASEVLQTILLSDEAEKLKVKLLTFLSDLESKMTSNPKIFVPAIRNFLQAAENVHDDNELAMFLKDFGKTEENVLKRLQEKRLETSVHCHTQTKLSGPVVRFAHIKSGQSKVEKCGKTCKKSLSSKLKMSATGNNECPKKKQSRVISSHPALANQLSATQGTDDLSCMSSQELKVEVHYSEQNAQTLLNCKEITAHTQLSVSTKELKKPSRKSAKVIKDRQKFASKGKKKRKQKTPQWTASSAGGNIPLPTNCLPQAQRTSGDRSRRLVIRLAQMHKTSRTETDS